MIWLILGGVFAGVAVITLMVAGEYREPRLLLVSIIAVIMSGSSLYHYNVSWSYSRETANFNYDELTVSETPEGIQYVEVGGEMINVNEKFGKSFKENETIYVKNYLENTVRGVHTNSYWTLDLEKTDDRRED